MQCSISGSIYTMNPIFQIALHFDNPPQESFFVAHFLAFLDLPIYLLMTKT